MPDPPPLPAPVPADQASIKPVAAWQPQELGSSSDEGARAAGSPQTGTRNDGQALSGGKSLTKLRLGFVLMFRHRKLNLLLRLMLLGCLVWTLWFILLTVYPDHTANWVMGTESFDDGNFWLLVQPELSLLVFGIVGFAAALAGYITATMRLLIWWKQPNAKVHGAAATAENSTQVTASRSMLKKLELVNSISKIVQSPERGVVTRSMAKLIAEVAREDSNTRKFAIGPFTSNAWVKALDLGLQVVLLVQALGAGSPAALVGTLAGVVVLNSVTTALMIYYTINERQEHGIFQVSIDIVFAFLIAIGFLMLAVTYSTKTFEFDRARYALNLQVFPKGEFETFTCITADPVKTAIVLKSLNSLCVRTVLGFFTCVDTNLALCYRLNCLVSMVRSASGSRTFANLYPKRHISSVLLFLVLFAVLLIVFAHLGVSTSKHACSCHPECAVRALRWVQLRDDDCTQYPCISLIDIETAPKTFTEWLQPRNLAEKVAQLASTGDPETIRLINRQLTVFSEELRRYTGFKHLCVSDRQRIEGKFGISSLVLLPPDMFVDMQSLAFIHLGMHPLLRYLPSFSGLTNLYSPPLAVLMALEELPDFNHLVNLEDLFISFLPTLDSFPDLSAPMVSNTLQFFVLTYRGTLYCNGFLDNNCDLSHTLYQANPLWGLSTTTCLPPNRTDRIAIAAMRSAFAKFASTVCVDVFKAIETQDDSPSEPNMLQCNSTMYRQCQLPRTPPRTGMCYNVRIMPITCNGNTRSIEMRRRQIQEGVGGPCNPKHEA